MNIKQRLDGCQGATILLVGDSLTGEQDYHYPWQLARKLAAKYPLAWVTLELRSINQSDPLPPPTLVQSGNQQHIHVIRDGVPGSTTYSTINRMANLYRKLPVHLVSFFLGTNDAIQGYAAMDVTNNLVYLGNTAKQNYGAEVSLITPAWSEDALSVAFGGYADLARIAADRAGFNLVDARRVFTRHYQATNDAPNYFGQGGWFADPSDHTHFGGYGHAAIADEFMRAHGW